MRILNKMHGWLLVAGLLTQWGCDPYNSTNDKPGKDAGPDLVLSDGPVVPTEGGADLAADGKGKDTSASSKNILPASTAITWSKRACTLTLTYKSTASSVNLAGSHNSWSTSAAPLVNKGGGVFEITLTPDGTTLVSGGLYAYKFVENGGTWVLDKAAPYRVFDKDFINSGFLMPPCDVQPLITASTVTTTLSGTSGTAKTRITVRTDKNGTAIKEVLATLDGKPLTSGTYTWDAASGAVDISLSGLAKGKYRLRFDATDQKGQQADTVELPFWIEDETFQPRDGLLYMFMIDRFADGETKSNSTAGCPAASDWHGGDLVGATAVVKSGYLDKLGARSIWISPVNEQVNGCWTGTGGYKYAGYHGYWPVKARQVDARFGGNQALKDFVAEAHKHGIRVLVDLINNQVHEQHEYYIKNPSWFRIVPPSCVCGTSGCGWSEKPFDCLFTTYLPDINWRIPAAEKQFIDDAVYWLTEFDLDGFRVDAVKHVEPNSIYNLRARLAQRFEQGGQRIWLLGETAVGEGDTYNFFGEYYGDGYQWIDSYTGKNGLDGQFDFPTHHQTQTGLLGATQGYDSVASVEAKAKAKGKYQDDNAHVRFLGTQDSSRAASIAANDANKYNGWGSLPPAAYTDTSTFQNIKRAFTILFTQNGIPFLYAGDEIGTPGGGDPDNRRNMIWTGSLQSLMMTSTLSATTLNSSQQDLLAFMQAIGQLRASNKALRRGTRTQLWVDSNLYVYAWQGTGQKELTLVAVNKGSATTQKSVGSIQNLAGVTSFKLAAGNGTATLSGSSVLLTLGSGEAAVFTGQ